MIIPTPVGVTDGVVAHGTQLNVGLVDFPNFFLGTPYCSIFRSAALSIPNGLASTLITWDAEVEDNDNMHSTVTNPSRITFTTAGVYLINGATSWTPSASTDRRINLRLNSATNPVSGTSIVLADQVSSPAVFTQDGTTPSFSIMARFNAGDYVEMFCAQNSATNPLALNVGTNAGTFLQAKWQLA